MEEKIRLGIIGVGNMGFTHARAILRGACERVALACVADTCENRLRDVARRLPEDVLAYDSAEALLAAKVCDAVLIATPHYFHPTIAIDAFRAGYHVLSEKPAGVYTSAVRKMNRAAVQSGRVFGVMFNQRTNPLYVAIRDLVRSGRLGTLRRSVWTITDWYRTQAYYDSGAWRATWDGEGGGILLNQCPHQLDLWQWICGMPCEIDAEMSFGKWHDIEVEDDVCARVRYANGASGLFLASTGEPCGINRLEITLSKGKIVCEDKQLRVWELEQDDTEYIKSCPAPYRAQIGKPINVPLVGENSQHCGILNDFAEAILCGKPLLAPGEEGIRALSISNAMHLSAWSGERIALPEDPNTVVPEWEECFEALLWEHRKKSRVKNTASVYTDTSDVKSLYRL